MFATIRYSNSDRAYDPCYRLLDLDSVLDANPVDIGDRICLRIYVVV